MRRPRVAFAPETTSQASKGGVPPIVAVGAAPFDTCDLGGVMYLHDSHNNLQGSKRRGDPIFWGPCWIWLFFPPQFRGCPFAVLLTPFLLCLLKGLALGAGPKEPGPVGLAQGLGHFCGGGPFYCP